MKIFKLGIIVSLLFTYLYGITSLKSNDKFNKNQVLTNQISNENSENRRSLIKYSTKYMRPTAETILDSGNNQINPRFLVDEVSIEDSFDPNSSQKNVYHDYNHDFEKHSVEEVKQRIYEHLAPEHVEYSFD